MALGSLGQFLHGGLPFVQCLSNLSDVGDHSIFQVMESEVDFFDLSENVGENLRKVSLSFGVVRLGSSGRTRL